MSWQERLKGDSLTWLLEPDDPGVRYLALRDVVGLAADDADLVAARREAHERGPIATILAQMHPDGYWAEPGSGYLPKYRSTVWSLISLAQLGASSSADERIATACCYYLDQALAEGGQIGTGSPSDGADCLQGNMCAALLDLGYDDPRLDLAFDWMARTVTGEGLAPASDRTAPRRYCASKCGPDFACGSNAKQSCAWGGTKVMLAFGGLPPDRHTPVIDRAIARGVEFFFSTDPAKAGYPSGYSEKPSGNWWKFGFPVFYITDVLQIVEALAGLGYGADPRLANAVGLVVSKQDAQGRWPLEFAYTGKMWLDYGAKKQPSKWVTLRALRALKAVAGAAVAGAAVSGAAVSGAAVAGAG